MDIFSKQLLMKNRELILPALKTALIFFAFGFIWVFVSDEAVHQLSPTNKIEHQLQTYKGWFFITLTAFFIYYIFNLQLKKIINYKNKFQISERSLSVILENIGEGIISTDRVGTITSMNKIAEELTRIKAKQATGQSFFETLKIFDFKGFDITRMLFDKPAILMNLNEPPVLQTIKGSKRVKVFVTSAPIYDNNGLHLGNIIAFRDISEKFKRDKALKDSEERYKNIVETTHDLIWSIDMQGTILYMNEACKKIYGYGPEEMIGQNFASFITEAQLKKHRDIFLAHQKGNFDTIDFQTEIKHKDGNIIYLNDNITDLRDEDGKLSGMLGASKNVTEKILAERDLHDSMKRLELALDGGGLGLWDYYVEPEKLTVSKQWGRMLGFEKEVTNMAQTFRSLIHPDDKNKVDDAFHGCFKNHKPEFNMEYRIKHTDGNWKWFLSKGKVMEWDKQGSPKRMVGINMDVTEKKLLELELKRWVNIYRSFIKYSGEGIYLFELEKPMPLSLSVDEQIKYFYKYGYVKTCNDAFAKMYGYGTSEELLGMKLAQLHGGEDVPENIEVSRKFINSNYRIMQSLSKEVDKEGNEIYLSNNVVGIIEGGELLRTWGSQSDITERKRAEDEIKKFKNVLDSSTDAIGLATPKGKHFYQNKTFEEMFGDIGDRDPITVYVDENVGRKVFETIMKGDEWNGETAMYGKDNEILDILLRAYSVKKDGKITALAGVHTDISKRKRAEGELQHRVEFERLVSEISSELVGVSGANINEVINHALASIGAFTNADRAYVFKYKNGGELMDNTHEWSADGVIPQIMNLKKIQVGELPWFAKIIQKHQNFHVPDVSALPPEAHLEQKHFEAQNIKSLICVPMETAGHMTGFLGFDCVREKRVWTEDEQSILRFIGQSLSSAQLRTQTEEALKESEEKYRLIAENSVDVIWKLDSQLNLTYLSPSLYEVAGFFPEEWIGTPLRKHTNWPSFAKMARIVLQIFRDKNKQEIARIESAFYNKSGKLFPVEIVGKSLVDLNGKIVGLQGSAKDITNRVLARQKLEDSERHYRLLFQTNPMPLVIIGVDKLNFLDVNRATEKLLGYTKNDISKLNLWDIRPEISIFAPDEIKEQLLKGSNNPREAKLMGKGGKLILVEIIFDVINYEGVQAVLAAFSDITALKESEKRVLQSIIEGEDNERKRVSKDIHDSLGQNLTAASLNFDALKQSITQLEEKEIMKFSTGLGFLKSAIEESRNIAHNLMPKAIEDFGLIPTLQSLLNQIEQSTGINVKFYENLGEARVNRQIELNLYRITQEAINNVIKHSKATEVFIQLVLHKKEIIYTFEDNGIGFDKSKVENTGKGLGLKNIFNRAKAMSGIFDLDTAPKSGTSITIEIPV